MKSEAYLSEIREAAGLKRAVLRKIEVEGKTVVFHLVTDLTYTERDVAHAEAVSARYAPAGYEGRARVLKSVPSEEGVRAAISEILKTEFPAAAAFVSPEDITVAVDGTGGRFLLAASEEERALFSREEVLNALSAELMRRFCGSWYGGYGSAEREEREIEREAVAPPEPVLAPRVFEIADYSPIDGAAPAHALYIADLNAEGQNITLCGQLLSIEERLTKKEKPYFSLSVSDGTGRLRASYFSKKQTLEKVRSLKAGDHICLTGTCEFFNGALRFTAQKLDYGAPPEGFVPVARPCRPVPAVYAAVRPEPVTDLVQANLFGAKPLPEDFGRTDFVVFDLETTGLTSSGSNIDRIIEIGAVKISGGEITEKFSSFVACPRKLSGEIVRLTGITDEMLVGAPETEAVIADFFKFCSGCALVGHNVQFDIGFIRFYGEQEGYRFDHRLYDTLALAQELLFLPRYKLDVVAEHFGFTFNHHRAFDDAFVTAKIFIELIRMRGGLPR